MKRRDIFGFYKDGIYMPAEQQRHAQSVLLCAGIERQDPKALRIEVEFAVCSYKSG